ncbi:hypothetical protein LSH36_14g03077 [Paralvinella palmiformis]|uniref:Uncharacterized protein n=1 Tax=Paralvinella palmiformis TaxID=53620 RepID=A0AAD9NHS6_9ANNE|nr:hypothetical protein LSH36_14g03077 [Paralvinella palmiformis]
MTTLSASCDNNRVNSPENLLFDSFWESADGGLSDAASIGTSDNGNDPDPGRPRTRKRTDLRPGIKTQRGSRGSLSRDRPGMMPVLQAKSPYLTEVSDQRPVRKFNIRNDFRARDRFRHAIKTVVILLKWISSLTEK